MLEELSGIPTERCPICHHTFLSVPWGVPCEIVKSLPVKPKKLVVDLAICTGCEAIQGATMPRVCNTCGATMEPLKAALRVDGQTIVFYTEE